MLDPDTSYAEAARNRRAKWSADHPDWLRAPRNRTRKTMQRLPFCGVDGEGGGTDEHHRQRYLLLRAGDAVLFNDNTDLRTVECLEFLASLDKDKIYVAFYFDYDVTMILRHATPTQRERILRPVLFGTPGERRATFVGDYEVEYLPHKYFKVKHINQKHWTTINECGPFFQCSFVKAITDWGTGTETERATIRVNKLKRSVFETITAVEIEYNRLECRHLEELMEKFREVCIDTDIVPTRWQGPGYLATDMFRKHGIPKRKEYGLDPEFLDYANSAYYGGRFELFKTGVVRNVHEYDINSAYPYAMQSLPCLLHGAWNKGTGCPDRRSLYVAFVRFENNGCSIANLPIRDAKSGSIYWPREGKGWYWSTEIEAALRTGTTRIVDWVDHWTYDKQCDCRPFDWLTEVYEQRKAIGKGTKGYALKLAINSLYGKTAQSIGSAPYANPVWAGLITAHCRAALIDAYARIDDRSIVMLATDGIYTTVPLDHLDCGGALGQWERKDHAEMFLVQPGIYFSSASAERPKTRGVPMALVLQYEEKFRQAFDTWIKAPLDLFGNASGFPSVELPMTVFVGMKLAAAWSKPFLAGRWLNTSRRISFDYTSKRIQAYVDRDAGCIHTFPRRGGSDIVTAPYSRAIGAWREDAAELSALLHDQPDMFAYAPQDEERI